MVFQLVDFSSAAPVPFSESDGPTGFDGMVPIGYTQSAAGAGLAAEAYQGAGLSNVYPEFIEKVSIGATSDIQEKAKRNSAEIGQRKEFRDAHKPGYYPASEGSKVEMIRPDYARVSMYSRGEKEDGTDGLVIITRDLAWVDGRWKMNFDADPALGDADELPEGAWSWSQS